MTRTGLRLLRTGVLSALLLALALTGTAASAGGLSSGTTTRQPYFQTNQRFTAVDMDAVFGFTFDAVADPSITIVVAEAEITLRPDAASCSADTRSYRVEVLQPAGSIYFEALRLYDTDLPLCWTGSATVRSTERLQPLMQYRPRLIGRYTDLTADHLVTLTNLGDPRLDSPSAPVLLYVQSDDPSCLGSFTFRLDMVTGDAWTVPLAEWLPGCGAILLDVYSRAELTVDVAMPEPPADAPVDPPADDA